MTPSHRSRLVLVTGALMAAAMLVYAIPALAQTGDGREDKALAQVEEREKAEQEKNAEEKGKFEEKGTAEQERVPQAGSILLGIAVGALLVGGGCWRAGGSVLDRQLLRKKLASWMRCVGWYFARSGSSRVFPGAETSSSRCSSR